MANTLTTIVPKILARGLLALRQRCIMPRLVNLSYGLEAKKKGSTIDIPLPSAIVASDVTPAVTAPTPSNSVPDMVQISMSNWKHADFHLTDKEQLEIDRDENFVPMQMSEAIKALANAVNQSIFDKYKRIYGVTKHGGPAATLVAPFVTTIDTAIKAKKKLHIQLCPRDDRRAVIGFAAEANANALAAFRDWSQSGDARVISEGELGRKLGFDWVSDDHVPTHTAGTLSDGTNHKALVNGALTAGTKTMNIDSATLTGTVVPGDIFRFGTSGDDVTYVVTNSAALTAASNAIAGITFYPALAANVADNAVVEFMSSHEVNMAFHRDAFAFASRPLEATAADTAGGNTIMSAGDPVSGLVLRLEIMRQFKQTVWDLDILWGTELIRPELAVRLTE